MLETLQTQNTTNSWCPCTMIINSIQSGSSGAGGTGGA